MFKRNTLLIDTNGSRWLYCEQHCAVINAHYVVSEAGGELVLTSSSWCKLANLRAQL